MQAAEDENTLLRRPVSELQTSNGSTRNLNRVKRAGAAALKGYICYDFKPEDPSNVPFDQGDEVVVLNNRGELWWSVRLVKNDHERYVRRDSVQLN